ncbi:hypothetical protein DQM68_05385 [Leptospira mayottensis]|uniref:Uncharacterized protein n=2 Tax=Leptospira mayottensis TaxID=1137606 RepID=A0AA87MSX7_9LEPT|nr:hypothetical protein DQM68_05385 [Leptospira mayottensis]AXR63523.1 hypothetical protein DQM28_04090 [Leptospira mayottensis]AZQ03353.1 hypothetical protein LEP1GSC190_16360 [Leptospira mayottensis 200901116]EKS01947.1 hypothetical protein LEP1GSC125_0270 [Leptospira mayottensis 200901122]
MRRVLKIKSIIKRLLNLYSTIKTQPMAKEISASFQKKSKSGHGEKTNPRYFFLTNFLQSNF